MRRSTGVAVVALLVGLFGRVGEARAADAQAHGDSALAELGAVDHESTTLDETMRRARTDMMTPTQRVDNGEQLLRAGDYTRAAIVFSKVVELAPGTVAAADARFLRGETYYASKEYLAARRDYWALAKADGDPTAQRYASVALARLVDVALRVEDAEDLTKPEGELTRVLARLDRVPRGTRDDALVSYARGKALYFKRDLGGAQAALAGVPRTDVNAHQARYFEGLVAYRQARLAAGGADAGPTPPPGAPVKTATPINFKPAVEAFRRATELPGDTPDHRHVIDLAWLAIGRLFYESEQYDQAIEAYSRLERESEEIDRMLFELAWVYVRKGDVTRAERSLELLAIINPDSQDIADGLLVRGDLLLRAGALRDALKIYRGVRERYVAMRDDVDKFVATTADSATYYDRLSKRELDAVQAADGMTLPPLAVKWAREEGKGPRAFALMDDVTLSRTLLVRSEELVTRINVVASSGNRAAFFPELLAGEMKAVGLLNRLSRARLEMARGLDASEPAQLGGEIAQVRQKRQELMGYVGAMPMASADFDLRERQGEKRWDTVSQKLTLVNQEVDRQLAVVNGLVRALQEDASHARSPEDAARIKADIELAGNTLREIREKAKAARRELEYGRMQVGFGDARYQEDARVRPTFRDLLEREVQLASQGQGGVDAQRFGARMAPALAQARILEDRLSNAFFAIDKQVQERAADLKLKVDAESANLKRYAVDLDVADKDVRSEVGEVLKANFARVAGKLHSIVLRADVGMTEQAWEVRQDELDQLRSLQTERARQEQVLDEELREVLDDAGEQSK